MTAAAAPLEKSKILTEVQKALGREFECEWLPGDASNRFYGRLRFLNSPPLILMVMNEPEAFKSEEVTGANEAALTELAFVTVDRNFAKQKIRVPQIEAVGPRSEFLVCEDFGDELLYQRRQNSPALDWYEKALDELAKIRKVQPFFPVAQRKFTAELLSWECEHFVEYALEKRMKVNAPILTELRKFMQRLVDRLSSSTYVVVHRDFHSKNLMILEKENRIGVIDFQDALMGPPTYDLVSLLRDSYVRLSDAEENRLIEYFEKATGEPVDRELFAINSLQRNLKAVGRFFYISMVKGKDTHLPFVKPSLLRIFQTLKDLKEVRTLSLLEGLLQNDYR